MIFRLTQKLNAKVKAGNLAVLPLDDNPLADWSAASFDVGRKQYILLTNTQTLYSTVFPGKGITNESSFIEEALITLLEFMEADGYKGVYERLIAPVSKPNVFAKTLNRSVTGSMNDMIKHATYYLTAPNNSLFASSAELNEIPMSALKHEGSHYGFPRRVFAASVERASEEGGR